MKKDISTIIIGLLFLAAGVAVGGSMLGYFDFHISLDGWWTLFLIVPALLAIAQGGINVGNIVLLAVGVILLLDQQRILPHNFGWRLIFPVILLAIGLQVLLGDLFRPKGTRSYSCCSPSGSTSGTPSGEKANEGTDSPGQATGTNKPAPKALSSESTSKGSYKTASVLFGGQDIVYGQEDFSGASYTAVFGGLDINMKSVILTQDVTINATAIFGGIEIKLPDNVRIVCNVAPVLGGTDIKYHSSNDPLARTVYITGVATFGGIDIK